MNDFSVTVLLPVHGAAQPEHVRAAVESIHGQTRPPDELLLVEDGPLPEAVVRSMAVGNSALPTRVLKLERHRGLAAALQLGLHEATSVWIARMDSDDIARPDRLEVQMGTLRRHPEYDVLGTAMAEFDQEPARVERTRVMPRTHEDIARAMRRVNPVNHPSVVFRRRLAMAVGGYLPLHGLEDYDLWARMLLAGATFHNLEYAGLLFRADRSMFERRASRQALGAELQLQRNLTDYGLINLRQAAVNLVLRAGYRLLPVSAMRLAHRCLFRPSRRRS